MQKWRYACTNCIYTYITFNVHFDFLQHQLNSMKEESESRLRQIESCNLKISHLSEEVKQKEATVAQLKSELRSYEQAYGTPEQQLKFLELSAQIAELEHRLQEVKEQKQQEELDKETAVREVDAMRKFRKLLHEQIGKKLLMIKSARLLCVCLGGGEGCWEECL